MTNMMSPYVWGAGGQREDPMRRAVAQSLVDMSPVGSSMEGFARMAQSGVDAYRNNPVNFYPAQPGGATLMGGLTGLQSRIFGGGGLY